MRIALNAQLLSSAANYRAAGINRVLQHLLTELPRVPGDEQYVVFAPDGEANRDLLRAPRVEPRLSRLPMDRPPVRITWEQAALPVELLRTRADLLHALGFVSPVVWRGRTVVTVYDLSFLRFPEVYNRANRTYLSTFTPPSLRRAERVITISEDARRDVIELCGVPPERVTPILLAADDSFRPASPEAIATFRERHGLPARFVLYMGTLQPRKNVELLVRAYAMLRAQGSDDHVLVLAGPRGWQYEPIFELIRRLGIEDSVKFPASSPATNRPCGIVARPCSRSRVATRASASRCWRRWRAVPPSSRPTPHRCQRLSETQTARRSIGCRWAVYGTTTPSRRRGAAKGSRGRRAGACTAVLLASHGSRNRAGLPRGSWIVTTLSPRTLGLCRL